MKTLSKLLLCILLFSACVDPVSEGERTCPCAEGWTCCAEVNLCVADVTQCERLRPPPPTAPSAPRQVAVTAKVRAAELAWFEPAKDGGSAVTAYHVTVDPAEEGQQVTVDGRTARVMGLRAGATYRFTVAARNDVGQGPAETSDAVKLPDVPEAPVALVVERGDAQARVSWQRPPSDGGVGITGYVVTAHPRGVSVEADVAGLSAVVTGLTNGEATTFTVRALNEVGPGPESEPSAPVTPARRPEAPASVSASPRVRSMSVSWQAPADTGGLPVASYVVTATPGGASQQIDGAITSATFNGLENDTSYAFTVIARNELGDSPPAGTAYVRTPTLPGAPQVTDASADVRALTVRWRPPTFDGREPLTGYTVTAQPSGVSVDVGADAREATLEGVPSSKAQSLTVTARNGVGQGPAASLATPVRARPAPVEVTKVEVPSLEGGCGSVSYEMRQVDGERVDVVVEVDGDADGIFTRATQMGTLAYGGLMALDTFAGGFTYTFHWNRARDIPGAAAEARVRVTAAVPGTPPSSRTVTVALPAVTRPCEVDFDSAPVQVVPEEPSWTAYDITPGDFDRDGRLDLAVLHDAGQGTSILYGRGNGRLSRMVPLRTSLTGRALSAGDLNQDGWLDLVTLDSSWTSLNVALGSSFGFSQAPVTTSLSNESNYEPDAPLLRDLDGDGAPEVMVSANRVLYVLRHTGGGALTVASKQFFTPDGPVVGGDFDQDGREDLIVVGIYLEAYFGNGLLSFTPVYVGDLADVTASVTAAASADFNGDGYPDLAAFVRESGKLSVVVSLNDGGGRFGPASVLAQHTSVGWETMTRLITGDWDGNGTQDLAYVYPGLDHVSLLHGRGDGTFERQELPCARYQQRIVAGDFDSSGKPDLAVLSFARSVRVLRDPQAPLSIPTAADVFLTADFDGDGWDDVATASATGTDVQVQLTRSTGELVPRGPFPVPESPRALLAGRFDAGPTMDLLVLTAQSGSLRRTLTLLRGNGDGTFGAGEDLAPGLSPTAMAAGDIDGDGDLDVAITDARVEDGTTFYEVHLLRGEGNGTFTPGPVLVSHTSPSTLALGDLNKDGRADLVVLRSLYPAFELGFFQGRADGTLSRVREQTASNCWASQLRIQDLNKDGLADVAVSCSGVSGGILPLLNSGQFQLYVPAYTPQAASATSFVMRDVDGDGWQDVVYASPETESVCVLPSGGYGYFGAPSCFGGAAFMHSVALLDVEHDGTPELLVGGYLRRSLLLRQR